MNAGGQAYCTTLNCNAAQISGTATINNNIALKGGIGYTTWAPYNNLIAFSYSNIYAGLVTVTVDNGALSYAIAPYSSDERLKQDIATANYDCLATIEKIPLFSYRWKDHSDPGNPRPALATSPVVPVGVVAQRIKKIAPYCVIEGRERGRLERDEDNELPPEPFVPWTIDVVSMLATLIGAVQQLSAKVAALEDAKPDSA